MQVFIEKENKTIEFQFNGTILQLLKKLAINPETVIVVRNNVIITEEVKIKNTDSILILSVVSGG